MYLIGNEVRITNLFLVNNRMRIFYIANIRFPTERAHGIQVAKMCEAFAQEGAHVTLLVPNRVTLDEDPFVYYGVEGNFSIEKISVPDLVGWGTLGFLIESFVFAWRATSFYKKGTDALIYTREELPLFFLPRFCAFYEAHQLRRSLVFRLLLRRARGVVAITEGLKRALVAQGLASKRIRVAHDGYDEKSFVGEVSREEARKGLGLPLHTKMAMYIGGLEEWKGAHILCEAAGLLSKEDIGIAVIGGKADELLKWKGNYPAVTFLGSRPYRELPTHQQAADILVIPNLASEQSSREFTSPLKLFAHMASGIPIVASAISALKEVLDEKTATFSEPDDAQSLAKAISDTFKHYSEACQKALRGKEQVKRYTWSVRARLVLDFISSVY